ncbi:unnamed protein product [Moneuplotes crassus]|uniref:mannose-6-phosphate isomerase n=1 Tax=Euplotes crassus TaxID=5936 RepID=A0AAD1XC35_EUPCR|nr:unnamed protein product [Moneuplotes crassus]
MIPIIAQPQKYHWGLKGLSSLVGQYVSTKQEDGKEDIESTHYAELWMGTHPKSPSMVRITEDLKPHLTEEFYQEKQGSLVELDEVIKGNSNFINSRVEEMDTIKGSGSLPFLFKILSVDTSLSIQAHPHKELAQELHEKYPDIYKDANHKPEMIIALTEYEALCSFSSGEDIWERICSNPALVEFYKDLSVEDLKDSEKVKSVLSAIIKITFESSAEVVTEVVAKLLTDIGEIQEQERTPHQKLALKLNTQYENDVGIIVCFLLNYIVLQPGEALVLKPNEPHAYLHGEGLECMATSDNVVRGGLTPKLKHAEVLVDMLTYETGPIIPMSGDKDTPSQVIYNSGFDEFSVIKVSNKAGDEPTLFKVQDPGILICIKGSGCIKSDSGEEYPVKKFDTLYCLPGKELAIQSEEGECDVYIATLGN